MESLYYLALLACPLMLVVMFWFMKGMMGDNKKSNQSSQSEQQIQQNMNQLMEQNQRLMKEMEDMKRSR